MNHIEIVSFGYRHPAPPPQAHVTCDLREHFRDPHIDPALRSLTAEHPQVVATVLATPGIEGVIRAAVALALAYRAGPAGGPVVIAAGCAGGRHRAPTVAAEIAARLARHGIPVTTEHRDMHRPVIERPVAAGAS